jgi:8-oxo-dGTP pyrophosphatase MutT (NUDIX family)
LSVLVAARKKHATPLLLEMKGKMVMPKEFASVVVVDENVQQVLLILRADFRIWGVPGGGIEAGETREQAAIRETLEETGYQVALDRYVGSYRGPQLNDLRHIFRAHVTGGQPLQSGPETRELRWFPVNELPARLTPSLRQIVADALADITAPIQRVQHLPWWQIIYFRFRIGLRDLRNRQKGS